MMGVQEERREKKTHSFNIFSISHHFNLHFIVFFIPVALQIQNILKTCTKKVLGSPLQNKNFNQANREKRKLVLLLERSFQLINQSHHINNESVWNPLQAPHPNRLKKIFSLFKRNINQLITSVIIINLSERSDTLLPFPLSKWPSASGEKSKQE